MSIRVHGDAVNGFGYGPGGRVIESAGADRTARLHRCATCAQIETLVRMARERIVSHGSAGVACKAGIGIGVVAGAWTGDLAWVYAAADGET